MAIEQFVMVVIQLHLLLLQLQLGQVLVTNGKKAQLVQLDHGQTLQQTEITQHMMNLDQ